MRFPKWPQEATPLCALSQSDKGNADNSARHDYTRLYHALFSPMREEVRTVFELGIFMGNSLRMWRDYFPNATIYGADIDEGAVTSARGERIVTAQVDECDTSAVHKMLASWPLFDIVIDDAIHSFGQNVKFFVQAWERVRPGGLYVIEDLRHDELEWFRRWGRGTIYDGSDRVVNGEAVPDNSVLVVTKS